MSGGRDEAAHEEYYEKIKRFTTPRTIPLVVADLVKREEFGFKKYGCYVNDSSDDMLQHLYEELLDAAVYIKTELERRKGNSYYGS